MEILKQGKAKNPLDIWIGECSACGTIFTLNSTEFVAPVNPGEYLNDYEEFTRVPCPNCRASVLVYRADSFSGRKTLKKAEFKTGPRVGIRAQTFFVNVSTPKRVENEGPRMEKAGSRFFLSNAEAEAEAERDPSLGTHVVEMVALTASDYQKIISKIP